MATIGESIEVVAVEVGNNLNFDRLNWKNDAVDLANNKDNYYRTNALKYISEIKTQNVVQ